MQFRHVCRRQYRHSQMNQKGPEWQTWQVHWISVLSDLIMTNEWAQWPWPASAISTRLMSVCLVVLVSLQCLSWDWVGGPGESQGRG